MYSYQCKKYSTARIERKFKNWQFKEKFSKKLEKRHSRHSSTATNRKNTFLSPNRSVKPFRPIKILYIGVSRSNLSHILPRAISPSIFAVNFRSVSLWCASALLFPVRAISSSKYIRIAQQHDKAFKSPYINNAYTVHPLYSSSPER